MVKRASRPRDIRPPKLSARLRGRVKNLTGARLSDDALRVVAAIRASVRDYDGRPEAITDLRRSVEFNISIWYQALLTGTPPSPTTLSAAVASGRRRAQQGVSLPGLLRAYRVGSREIWSVLLDACRAERRLHQELLFQLSPYLLFHFDLVAQTAGQAYALEQHRLMRWQDRLRHDLCAVIFNNPENTDAFRSHAQALGLDAAAPHAALALRLEDALGTLTEFDDALETLLGNLTRLLRLNRDQTLHSLRNGHLLFWLPLPRGETPLSHERKLARQAESIREIGVLGVGLGLCGEGARGWQRSAQQAMKAIELGARLSQRGVQRYADYALDDAIMGSEESARYFDHLLDRLVSEPGLLETLATYFDLGQHRKAVAARLGVHPNTLDYRLRRIETLMDTPLSDTGWAVKLHTALRLRRMRGTQSA